MAQSQQSQHIKCDCTTVFLIKCKWFADLCSLLNSLRSIDVHNAIPNGERKCVGASIFYQYKCECVCLYVCVSSASEPSALKPHIYSFLCQLVSPSYGPSYHCKMWPFFSHPIHVNSGVITLWLLVASTSLKIKLTHSASLLCCCNYKSSLSLHEQQREMSKWRCKGIAEQNCGWGRGEGAACLPPSCC